MGHVYDEAFTIYGKVSIHARFESFDFGDGYPTFPLYAREQHWSLDSLTKRRAKRKREGVADNATLHCIALLGA